LSRSTYEISDTASATPDPYRILGGKGVLTVDVAAPQADRRRSTRQLIAARKWHRDRIV